jgi:hypothetical protein
MTLAGSASEPLFGTAIRNIPNVLYLDLTWSVLWI